jgi:adenylate cyclase
VSRPRATVSIRWSLFQSLILVVVLITTAIMFATWQFGQRTVRAVSRSLLDRAADHADTALQQFLAPARDDIAVIRTWTSEGVLDPRSPESVNALLMPLLASHPQVDMFTTGDPAGYHILLRREGDSWFNREMRPEWGSTAHTARWRNARTLIERGERPETFNHRERPWYKANIGRSVDDEIYWTRPYLAHDSQKPIMTAALRMQHPQHGPLVGAVHVFLEDLSAFTTRMAPSPNGVVAVLDDANKLVGLPRHPRFEDREARADAVLLKVSEAGVPSLAVATERWRGLGRPLEPFQVTVEGEKWWAGFRRVPLSDKRSLWIGTLVPESDFVGAIEEQQKAVLMIALVVLGLSALISLLVARSYSVVLDRLVEQSERIQNLELAPGKRVGSRLREVNQVAQAQERMRVALESFSKYVPIELVRELLKRGEAAQIGGRTEVLTVFFSDIRGFTTISERIPPEELTAQMAEYFEAMLAVLTEEKATIDKFIGDAIMAFWGAPNPDPQHAMHGVRAALRCQARLTELNAAWVAAGKPALHTRIGLATGRVLVGNVGAPNRLNYTLLGDTANLASRLEGTNRFYGTSVLASAATHAAAESVAEWREIDRVAVKGKHEAVAIFEPIGLHGEVDPEIRRRARAYEALLARFRARDFAGTLAGAAAHLAEFPDDLAAERLVVASKALQMNPPGDDWVGATSLDEK